MKKYVTEIRALDPITGDMKTYCGPNIPALTWGLAEQHCQQNGLGYCKVIGELISEIPCKPGTYEADFDGEIDYSVNQDN